MTQAMAASISGVTTDEVADGYRVPAVERAFAILHILAARGPLSLAALVEASALNKSTTYYILRTLVSLEMVEYQGRTRNYMLGSGILELGASARGPLNAIAIARRYLSELLEKSNVTIVLYRRVNRDEIVLVDTLERAHRVRITLQAGVRIPIQGGSFGRAFLAFDTPAEARKSLRNGLHPFTPKSIMSVKAFQAELVEVRERGWAIDQEGFALGVSSIAAPIFGPNGRIVFVAAAVGFANVLVGDAAEQVGTELRHTCDRIGEAITSQDASVGVMSSS